MRPRDGINPAAEAMRGTIGFALLVAAHFAVRPLFGARWSVDFLVIAVLFAAVRVRPGFAALIGFAAGLAVDSISPGSFGSALLVFTSIAYVASRTKTVFFADYIALTGLFVFLGKWLFDVGYVLVGRGVHGVDLAAQLLVWSPVSAVITALVALLLLTLMRPLYSAQGS